MIEFNKSQHENSFLTLLGLLFIGLKLGHVINWSWWYVTMPLWIGVPIIIIFFVIIFLNDYFKGQRKNGK